MSSRLLPKPPVARMTLFPLKVLCSLVRRLTAATPTIFPPEVSSPSTFVDQRKWIFGYRKHSRKSGPTSPHPFVACEMQSWHRVTRWLSEIVERHTQVAQP